MRVFGTPHKVCAFFNEKRVKKCKSRFVLYRFLYYSVGRSRASDVSMILPTKNEFDAENAF
jgi:hypothetical protein